MIVRTCYKILMSPQGAHGFYREIVQAAMKTQGRSLVVNYWSTEELLLCSHLYTKVSGKMPSLGHLTVR